MILTMTLAQIACAVPIVRVGRHLNPVSFLRILVFFRTCALVAIALLAAWEAPLFWLAGFAAVAGSVNGAVYGHLRLLLSSLTHTNDLPRALGIAATLNELTFVLAPVAASGIGSISPMLALLCFAGIGAIPVLLLPSAPFVQKADAQGGSSSLFNGAISLWLLCAAAGSAIVAATEIGAVSLALKFGYEPVFAFLFTVPLCLASVLGGVWVSVRNRISSEKAVTVQLFIAATGALITALQLSVTTTIVGTILMGLVIAPLGTYYSLKLDQLAPPVRRAEVFALLRTANASGIIIASSALTLLPLNWALMTVTLIMLSVASTATIVLRKKG
ncbi:MFS transporter [Ochrobactrum sp. BTU1]|uniref:MFS transporter n=1 Tax=Ochrobactrum sp. BTU1 TaxID=2840456 RepID=UPI001C055448|nr:MFS transporter [Ochrobactrum sp. BTU1]